VQGSQASIVSSVQTAGGSVLPPSGRIAASGANPVAAEAGDANTLPTPAAAKPAGASDPQTLVTLLNRYLNDSGRPDQFRVDPASSGKLIQQVNPQNGAVIGEFSASEFPALARSVGASGLLVDSLA